MPTAAENKIRVLIVDDDPMVRSALKMLLSAATTVEVVGESSDGAEVEAAVDDLEPQVILMDIRMAVVDGLTATERLLSRTVTDGSPLPKVIVLTTFEVDDQVLRALRAGASGFLLKDTPPEQIIRAIENVVDGEAILSPAITKKLVDHVAAQETSVDSSKQRQNKAKLLINRLSDREREVADCLAKGLSNAEISEQLFMSLATVKAHVSKLMEKLDVDNRVQIALIAHDASLDQQ